MNLDDVAAFRELDSQRMIAQIDGLPNQLERAYQLGERLELPEMPGLKAVYMAGVGGSAIGADLVAACLSPTCPVPLVVGRGYDLPGWVRGKEILVILSSHSGNTEETLACLEAAVTNGCRILAITTGGSLALAAERAGGAVWQFAHGHAPRAAVGFSYGLIHSALFRLGLVNDPSKMVHDALHDLRDFQSQLMAGVPVALNPAKRMAGQMVGRNVVVFGADILAPVARRWKGQINEMAKAWAQSEELPEADHNLLAGSENPEAGLTRLAAIFLRAAGNHPRNRLRLDLTREIFMEQGINTDKFTRAGRSSVHPAVDGLAFWRLYSVLFGYGIRCRSDPGACAGILENHIIRSLT